MNPQVPYGGSYSTSWRGQYGPQDNPVTNPGYATAPAQSRPNFNPMAGNPWANPSERDVGDWQTSTRSGRPWDSNENKHGAGDFISTQAWKNPLEVLFGQMTGQSNDIRSANPQASGQGTPIYGYARDHNGNTSPGGSGMPDQMKIEIGRDYGGSFKPPVDAKDLYNQIGGLSKDQLMGITSGVASLSDRFGRASQDYANAYANPLYGKHVFGQQDTNFGANSLSMNDNSSWLSKSYDSLMKRMDDSYLL